MTLYCQECGQAYDVQINPEMGLDLLVCVKCQARHARGEMETMDEFFAWLMFAPEPAPAA